MNLDELMEKIPGTTDRTDEFAADDIAAAKGVCIAAAVLPVLFFLPVVSAKGSEYGKFYANQTLIYFILAICLNIVNGILGGVLALIPVLGAILAGLIGLVVGLTNLACWLFLVINAAQGKARPLPFVGEIVTIFK